MGDSLGELRTKRASPNYQAVAALMREDEAATLESVALFIAGSAVPEDPRYPVMDAIARHLGLGWSRK